MTHKFGERTQIEHIENCWFSFALALLVIFIENELFGQFLPILTQLSINSNINIKLHKILNSN